MFTLSVNNTYTSSVFLVLFGRYIRKKLPIIECQDIKYEDDECVTHVM